MPDALSNIGRAYQASTGRPESSVYVSANTRKGTTLEDVPTLMQTPEHQLLRHDTPGSHDAVGVWVDGAEPSRIVPHADALDAAKLGLRFKRKTVLHWVPGAGTAVRHIVAVPSGDTLGVVEAFQDHGVHYLTAVPKGDATLVHVIDMDNALGKAVREAAGALSSKVRSERGTATFYGDWDSAERAAEVFRKMLSDHGVAHD